MTFTSSASGAGLGMRTTDVTTDAMGIANAIVMANDVVGSYSVTVASPVSRGERCSH